MCTFANKVGYCCCRDLPEGKLPEPETGWTYKRTPVVGRSLEHHAGDSTIYLGSTPILRENTLREGQGPPSSLSHPPTSREDSRLNGYSEYSQAVKALYIYKHPCLLRDSNLGPTAQ
ncbi:uncharacterized protein TNCV_3159721 [Trichonephila clavipes]|nr:uncharacterized protein TNCV_3159721 [Trichonephila clavipes]